MKPVWIFAFLGIVLFGAAFGFYAIDPPMRENCIRLVDASTGETITSASDSFPYTPDFNFGDGDDPFWHYGSRYAHTPDGRALDYTQFFIEWNKPVRFFIAPKGYEKVALLINDQSPPTIIVRLHKVNKSTTGP